jgi:hypothetical protein
MAEVKISELSAAATLTGDEQVPVVQSASTVRTTVGDVRDGLVASTDIASIVVVEESNYPVTPDPSVLYVVVEDPA